VGSLAVQEQAGTQVWRVGYRPQPWAWVGWEWASEGRFPGRWDDAEGNFRTVYAGSSLLGCLLELLADFRADPLLADDLGQIVEDPEDATMFPTVPAGMVDPAWLTGRVGATARLTGRFGAVTAARSLAALHPVFIGPALRLGLRDFDAAALKDARARELTQQLASHVYATTSLDGVVFQSRHGDDITLWAVFERPGDGPISPCLGEITHHELHVDHPDVTRAMELLGLQWHTPANPDPAR
jgi:hypothetical protein